MFVSSRRLGAAPLAAVFAALTASAAIAAPATVDLVFYAPHFAKVQDGSTISYRFKRTAEDPKLDPSFEDKVDITVGPQGAENSLQIDMFSGKRALSLPNMSKTGNPIVVAVLEEDVKEMQKTLGGSPFYFRNRLRTAMSADKPAEPTKVEYDGKTVDGWKISIKPFEDDLQNRSRLREFAERSYELTFSESVPGGLYSLKTVTPRIGGAAGGALLTEELTVMTKADAVKQTEAAKSSEAAKPAEAGK